MIEASQGPLVTAPWKMSGTLSKCMHRNQKHTHKTNAHAQYAADRLKYRSSASHLESRGVRQLWLIK